MAEEAVAAGEIKMPGTPKPWMNRMMMTLLKVPGLRRLLSRSFAVITVTGAKTGRKYTTPIQYMTVGQSYVVLSQKHRVWWRNIRTRPEVELLIAGKLNRGEATIAEGEEAHNLLSRCLEDNPKVGKFYGLTVDNGSVPPSQVAELTDRMVVIEITSLD